MAKVFCLQALSFGLRILFLLFPIVFLSVSEYGSYSAIFAMIFLCISLFDFGFSSNLSRDLVKPESNLTEDVYWSIAFNYCIFSTLIFGCVLLVLGYHAADVIFISMIFWVEFFISFVKKGVASLSMIEIGIKVEIFKYLCLLLIFCIGFIVFSGFDVSRIIAFISMFSLIYLCILYRRFVSTILVPVGRQLQWLVYPRPAAIQTIYLTVIEMTFRLYASHVDPVLTAIYSFYSIPMLAVVVVVWSSIGLSHYKTFVVSPFDGHNWALYTRILMQIVGYTAVAIILVVLVNYIILKLNLLPQYSVHGPDLLFALFLPFCVLIDLFLAQILHSYFDDKINSLIATFSLLCFGVILINIEATVINFFNLFYFVFGLSICLRCFMVRLKIQHC